MSGPSGDPGTWSNDQWMDWYDQVLAKTPQWKKAADEGGKELATTHMTVHDSSWTAALKEVSTAMLSHRTMVALPATGDRQAFEMLSPEFKMRLHAWHESLPTTAPPTTTEPHWDATLPEEESIIDELEPIVIVGGEPSPEEPLDWPTTPPEEPPADDTPVDVMAAPPDPTATVAQTGVTDLPEAEPEDAAPEPPESEDPEVEWPEDPWTEITIGLPNDNTARVNFPSADEDPSVYVDEVEMAEKEERDKAEAERRDLDKTFASATASQQELANKTGCLSLQTYRPTPTATIAMVVFALLAIGAVWAVLAGGGNDAGTETSEPAETGESDELEFAELDEPLEPIEAVEDPNEPVDVSDGIPEPPFVAHPCDILPMGDVQTLTGTTATGERTLDQDRRKACDYFVVEGGGINVQIEAHRNNQAIDFLREFQRSGTVVKPLDWGAGAGEIRVIADDTISLWSYVIADQLGRDLFIWITINGLGDPGARADAIETLGIQLRDGLRAVQPE